MLYRLVIMDTIVQYYNLYTYVDTMCLLIIILYILYIVSIISALRLWTAIYNNNIIAIELNSCMHNHAN